ncbi:MAG: hypothetical protein OEZ32_13705 [Nitrospinota bacterium]|nr:hypothetical protein [Nitrospinota bacterium]
MKKHNEIAIPEELEKAVMERLRWESKLNYISGVLQVFVDEGFDLKLKVKKGKVRLSLSGGRS